MEEKDLALIMFILFSFIGVMTLILIIKAIKKTRERKLLKTVTKLHRGTKSERKLVLELLKLGIPADAIFHDIYLRKTNGDYTQIDLVVLVDTTVIVFEVKDYKGWIFGSGNNYKWTQVLAYGNEKYRFYNPVKQNYNHIIALKNRFKHLGNIPYHSVIIFDGDCVLKRVDYIPIGTTVAKVSQLPFIMNEILSLENYISHTIRDQISIELKEAVMNGDNNDIITSHIESIREMLGSDDVYYN
ncbi:MAG: NERD domain-containing protein [Fermentimonas sp.]|nr:NERD domain-containing protein [Fermentimonas sp.]